MLSIFVVVPEPATFEGTGETHGARSAGELSLNPSN